MAVALHRAAHIGRPYKCTRTGVHDKGVLHKQMGIGKTICLNLNIGLSSSDVVQHDRRSARNIM
eukprot:15380054-Heterocapsa_arctica.AAC.1